MSDNQLWQKQAEEIRYSEKAIRFFLLLYFYRLLGLSKQVLKQRAIKHHKIVSPDLPP